jgi:hypothetical protein
LPKPAAPLACLSTIPRNAAILDRTLSANIGRPVLVEAVVDPFETPTPAKVTVEQQRDLLNRCCAANPTRTRVDATQIADKVRSCLRKIEEVSIFR